LKSKTLLKIIFLSMVLSSCGLIEKFKTPDQPTDSKEGEVATTEGDTTNREAAAADTDDLFSKTLDESNTAQASNGDNPTHLSTATPAETDEMKSLEEEFATNNGTAPVQAEKPVVKEAPIAVTPTSTPSTRKQEKAVVVEEAIPEIKTEVTAPTYSSAGAVKSYRVQKGETLMQIAFKLYGDISKWKELKQMNAGLRSNSSLKANTELKYHAPASNFVWNPNGTPYLIKTGETLGTISNAVYSTPKKWKTIWENNRPLIKNPNVIYAGFTLYYTNGGMANYVQPKTEQPAKEIAEAANNSVEEVEVEKLTKTDVQTLAPAPAAKPEIKEEVITKKDEEHVDEAMQTLSATQRNTIKRVIEKASNDTVKEGEIDLINNVQAPLSQDVPQIDEDVQTL
jgi:nucleoid-associated protein YgaU